MSEKKKTDKLEMFFYFLVGAVFLWYFVLARGIFIYNCQGTYSNSIKVCNCAYGRLANSYDSKTDFSLDTFRFFLAGKDKNNERDAMFTIKEYEALSYCSLKGD
ncbi:MAG: hypothetical protein KGV56_00910 [Gammaproteobacteria bacterium]|nr:hypothetical protein [Gammaproteobacteria bacterium]